MRMSIASVPLICLQRVFEICGVAPQVTLLQEAGRLIAGASLGRDPLEPDRASGRVFTGVPIEYL